MCPTLAFALLAAAAAAPESLPADALFSRTLAPGAGAVFSVDLRAGDWFHLAVHATAPAVVRLVDAAGRELAKGELGWENNDVHLAVLAEAAGPARLEVQRLTPDAPTSVRFKPTGPRPATPGDKQRLEAERLFDDYARLAGLGTPEGIQQGLQRLDAALALWTALGDPDEQVLVLLNAGAMRGAIGEGPAAVAQLERCVAVARQIGDPVYLLEPLEVLAGELQKRGDAPLAMPLNEESLALRARLHDREAIGLYSLAATLGFADRLPESIEVMTRGLERARLDKDPLMEARLVENRAIVLAGLGEAERALPDLQAALAFHRQSGFRRGEGSVLGAIGNAHFWLGDLPAAARAYEEGVAVLRQVGDPGALATALVALGTLRLSLGKPAQAREQLLEARALAGPAASARTKAEHKALLASAELDAGNPEAAGALARELLPETRALQFRSFDLNTLRHLCHVLQGLGELREALRLAQQIVDHTEQERKVLLGEGKRSSFVAARRKDYRRVLEVLLALHQQEPGRGWDAQALASSERGRARSLLDLLEESQADVREGVDPALLARERDLVKQLAKAAQEERKLRAAAHTGEQLTAASARVARLSSDHKQVEAELRAKSPRYAALTQPQPLDLAALQEQVLDDGTLLLEYALGDARSVLWVVGKRSLATLALPGREELEAAARAVYQAWSEPGAVSEAEAAAREARLSALVLGPAAALLGDKRLLLVTEGALQYVPFGALPLPGKGPAQPLLARHEIVNLPSASTLAVLRREQAGRPRAPRLLAALADPVFDPADPRVEGATPARAAKGPLALAGPALSRSASDAGLTAFERLVATRGEATGIASLAGAGGSLLALDFDASVATARRKDLADYRFVHFASHGLLDSRNPELSGLVLSTVGKDGLPQDGFLQLHDIYNLHLAADLVVLSACQTALGKEVWGEGLVGLVRGFMYAGAARVVASAWKVPDRATSELMQRFYAGMLVRKLPPAAALREAQLSLWRGRRFSSKHEWAGFSLQGDWK